MLVSGRPRWLTGAVETFNLGVDQLRVILHVLGVTIWLGGQLVMMGLVPALRGVDGATKVAANAFGRVAWPAFALVVITGIWNIFAIDMAEATTGYNMAFGVKMLLVVVSGLAAALHQRTESTPVRAMTGALGLLAALAAFVIGAGMGH